MIVVSGYSHSSKLKNFNHNQLVTTNLEKNSFQKLLELIFCHFKIIMHCHQAAVHTETFTENVQMVKTILAAAIFGLSLNCFAQEDLDLFVDVDGQVVDIEDVYQAMEEADENASFAAKSTIGSTVGGCGQLSPGSSWIIRERYVTTGCVNNFYTSWINVNPSLWTTGEILKICSAVNPDPIYWEYIGKLNNVPTLQLNHCYFYNTQNGKYTDYWVTHQYRRR